MTANITIIHKFANFFVLLYNYLMKVSAGIYKGRKLVENKYEHIRPTADLVKQALFNTIAIKLSGARVLDLFAGTGALGIEALSRGAQEVVFVDKDNRSVKLIKQNLDSLDVEAQVLCKDFSLAIKLLSGRQFDIILIDPPYKKGLYEKVLSLIEEGKLLADGGVIVCEHAKEDKIDPLTFEITNEKRYGTKMLTFLQ